MQIACPQCSMQYDLDPRLLPPSGASVQCTRCRFVFTATPSGEVLFAGQGTSGGSAAKGGEGARGSPASTTRIFGSPYGAPPSPGEQASAPSAHTTQIFGALQFPASGAAQAASPVAASSRTPAAGVGGVSGSSLPAAGKTQVFGAASLHAPSPATTQVFGAASIPTPAPSAATTQVFGAASLQTPPPSAATTQVFGAASIASKASQPATTQASGAASLSSPPPSPATTQVFGAADVQARKTPQGAAPIAGDGGASVPWMAAPGPSPAPSPPRSATGELRPGGPPVASLTLPEEPVSLPPLALPSLPPEPMPAPAPERGGALASSRRVPALELPPEIFAPGQPASARPAPKEAGAGRERLLFILAAVAALGLTAWLSYPVWRNQGSELPPEALSAKDRAASLLRRDDAASRERAIEELGALVGRYPKFTEAQAELVVALSLHLDDVKVELEWIDMQEAQLQKEISALQLAKSPADWKSRVNVRSAELAALGVQKRPLAKQAAELTQQLDKNLGVIRAAPETEPSADVVARVKAQAVYESVQGTPQALALAERLRKVESPPHWSALTRAEYGLNARSPPAALPELAEALRQVREQDNTFLRAYVLGARLALRQQDPATAHALLDTVVALNPSHTLARKLQKWASSPPLKP